MLATLVERLSADKVDHFLGQFLHDMLNPSLYADWKAIFWSSAPHGKGFWDFTRRNFLSSYNKVKIILIKYASTSSYHCLIWL